MTTWFDYIKENPDKLNSHNDCFTIDIINLAISKNPNVTWDTVCENPDWPWNYKGLSANPNITWDIVQENPDLPWNYKYLSTNPNITWDIVQENLDKR